MSSSITKTSAFEATKPQAVAPNFLLSLLAACSTSVPAAGSEGEATFSNQLSGLLEDKAMAADQLSLLYSYRFGLSINDALNFIGFHGNFLDFLDQQKRFSIHDGCISVLPTTVPTIEEPPADSRKAPHDDCTKVADDETASSVSTADAESCNLDSDLDIDVIGWHSVGNRFIAALDSPSCDEADADVVSWELLGGHVGAALHAADDGDITDVEAWRDVGSRISAACCRHISDGECCEDPSPDVDEWRSVGARVLRLLDGLESDVDDL